MKLLCDTMKRQIVSRAFYGWLAHCRHLKTIRLHLVGLVHVISEEEESEEFKNSTNLTNELWLQWLQDEKENEVSLKKYEKFVHEFIYYNGLKNNELRVKIWPFLLKHYTFEMTAEERFKKDVETKTNYSNLILEWKIFEDFIRQRDLRQKSSILENNTLNTSTCIVPPTPIEISSDRRTSTCIIQNINKEKAIDKDLNLTPIVTSTATPKLVQIKNSNFLRNDLILLRKDSSLSNEVFMDDMCISPQLIAKDELKFNRIQEENLREPQPIIDNTCHDRSRHSSSCSFVSFAEDNIGDEEEATNCMTRNIDIENSIAEPTIENISAIDSKNLENKELLENFATNIHRIDKDVTRCDRNYFYFVSNDNLQKLRNIMYT